jgi:hypothetical protein
MFCLASESDSNVTVLRFRVRVHVLFLMCAVHSYVSTCVWLHAFLHAQIITHTDACISAHWLALMFGYVLCMHVCVCVLFYVIYVVWCLALSLCTCIRLSVFACQGTSVARQGALSESSRACRNRFGGARGFRTQKSFPNTKSCPKILDLDCLLSPCTTNYPHCTANAVGLRGAHSNPFKPKLSDRAEVGSRGPTEGELRARV